MGVLEGYVDSEGSIERRRGAYFFVVLSTVDKGIAETLLRICKMLGFKHGIYEDVIVGRRKRYRIFIFDKVQDLKDLSR